MPKYRVIRKLTIMIDGGTIAAPNVPEAKIKWAKIHNNEAVDYVRAIEDNQGEEELVVVLIPYQG